MKYYLLVIGIIILKAGILSGQEVKIYNPEANAKEDIAIAVKKASESNKHVFIQIGGNWCSWCIKFHRFVENDIEIKEFVKENFEVVHVNYDPENKNEEVLKGLGFPQRFGFPVFVILDGKGQRIHTQNTALLEKGDGYDREKVLRFYKNWSALAIDPDTYK